MMKSKHVTKFVLLLLLFVSAFSSCKDEEVTTEGTLKVVLSKNAQSLYVYPIEAPESPFIYYISDFPYSSEFTYQLKLNYGNYTLQPRGDNYYTKVNLQVLAGQTTTVIYNASNSGTVLPQ